MLQIISVGIQDNALTKIPELTFWKASYKQYSPFAIESIEQIFQGQCDFGRKSVAIVGRAGDLMGQTILQATLPSIDPSLGDTNTKYFKSNSTATNVIYARWLDFIGEQMLQEVSIDIGGNTITKYYGDYMHIWNQLSLPESKIDAYYKMIGHTTQLTYLTDPHFAPINGPCSAASAPGQVCVPRNTLPETTLYIPLMFWFCQNPGMALPILALQFHEVRINISFRPLLECLWAVTSLSPSSGASTAARNAYNQSLVAASLYIDYTFCEVEERKFFVGTPHEYLFDQLQFSGDLTVGVASARLNVNLSHPVQEIIFVAQPDINVDYCSAFDSGEPLFNQLGVQAFNYTDALDALPNAIHAFGSPDAINDTYTADKSSYGVMVPYRSPSGQTSFMFQQPSAPAIKTTDGKVFNSAANEATRYTSGKDDVYAANVFATVNYDDDGKDATGNVRSEEYLVGLSDPAIYVISETAFKMHCWGENPVITCRLSINNTDRFTDREGSYFDLFQPFQVHTRAASSGINVYSFAINPEALQPSGTLNFSRVDNAYLIVTLSSAAIFATSTCRFRIYGRGKNILRIIGGMCGVAFAS